jgi:hypothetical protein
MNGYQRTKVAQTFVPVHKNPGGLEHIASVGKRQDVVFG